MTRTRRRWLGRLPVLIGLASGCAEELGPERLPTTRVNGIVRAGSRPVGGGWIEFTPVDGTVGNLRVAPIAPDGSFTADGVAVGTNRVTLVETSADPRLGRLFHPNQSPLRREVTATPTRPMTIDLLAEALSR